MRFKKILSCLLLTGISCGILTSCGEPKPLSIWEIPVVGEAYQRPNSDAFNEAIDNFKEAGKYNAEELMEEYYRQISEYLTYIEDLRTAVSQNQTDLDPERIGEEMTFLYTYYWTLKSKEVSAVQNVLSSKGKNTFRALIGDAKAEEYLSIATADMFINRTYTHRDSDYVTQYTDKIISYSSSSRNGLAVLTAISKAIYAMYDLMEDYAVCTIHANMDLTDSYYSGELVYITNLINTSQNEYTRALMTAFTSPCRSYLENKLGADTIESFLSSSVVLPDSVLEMQSQEATLLVRYSLSEDTEEQKSIYADLINLRNAYTDLLNEEVSYDFQNYEEYAFSAVYGRDYTPSNASDLTQRIVSALSDDWILAGSQIQTVEGTVTERDLWNALGYVGTILPDCQDALSHLKNYGLYTFDVSPNKYTGSYVIGINSIDNPDAFLYLGATGTTADYTSAFHEFGHYYADYVEDEELASQSYQCLDLAEINSQALELLMMDSYESFLDEDSSVQLRKNQIANALWALFSGAAIFEFEHSAYNYNGSITVEALDELWNDVYEKYALEGYQISYEMVPHIYQQPCYYISYVTSMISSLELWSMPREQAETTYKMLAVLGTYNPYLATLEACKLSDPFTTGDLLQKIRAEIEDCIS